MLTRSSFVASLGGASLIAFRGEAAIGRPSRQWRRGMRTDTVAYQVVVNANVSQYENLFSTLAGEGYVPISIDIYGDVGNELYAAVWVQRPSIAWLARNGTTLAGVTNIINTYAPQGFVATIFGVTGDASNQTCVIKMEQSFAYWWYYTDLANGSASTPGTFQYYDALYRSQNYDLAAFAVYGDPGDPQYIAAWSGNGTATAWADSPVDIAASLRNTVETEKRAGFRPSLIARNADGIYASIYRGDNIGPWSEHHELTEPAFATLYDTLTAKGYYPISLRAGGPTAKPIFASVFARTDLAIPKPRRLTFTGTSVPAYAPIENAVTTFMQTNGVRAGQLTIAQNGVVQYERAFTWAEKDYPVTQTTSLFRLASVSKAFVEAAIQTLYDRKKLKPGTLVFPRLRFSGPNDPRSDTITVQELLDHQGGYDDTIVPDPVFSMRGIALDLGLHGPIDALQFLQWIYYSQPLQFTPGTKTVYSNTGYAILSYLISIVARKPFIKFIQEDVMEPLGVNKGVELSNTLQSARLKGEVVYDDDEVGLSAVTVLSPVLQPAVYGGDQLLYEVAQGATSIATTATAVATLIHTWMVYGNGPRIPPGNWYYQRDGSMPGTTSVAGSRGNDGFDFCFIFNTRNWPPGSSASPPDDLANTINMLLNSFDSGSVRHTGRTPSQRLPDLGEPLRRHGGLQNARGTARRLLGSDNVR